MEQELGAASWTVNASLVTSSNAISQMKRLIESCRSLNESTLRESDDPYRYAKVAGQCQSTIDMLEITIQIMDEKVKDGLSASAFLIGDCK